jgi:clan AA aspartic protease
MGTFGVTIHIGDLGGTRFEEVEALADTGATTTVIPRPILNDLGISPTRQETFEYASGQQARLDMAQATAQTEGRETITWVIFGEEGMSPLLGAYTLEGLFLAVDPYNQRLVPVNGVLK